MWMNTSTDKSARHGDHHGGTGGRGWGMRGRQVTVIPDTAWEVPQENSNTELWGPVDKGIGKT